MDEIHDAKCEVVPMGVVRNVSLSRALRNRVMPTAIETTSFTTNYVIRQEEFNNMLWRVEFFEPFDKNINMYYKLIYSILCITSLLFWIKMYFYLIHNN